MFSVYRHHINTGLNDERMKFEPMALNAKSLKYTVLYKRQKGYKRDSSHLCFFSFYSEMYDSYSSDEYKQKEIFVFIQ